MALGVLFGLAAGFGDADMALGVLFGLAAGFSGVLTGAGKSGFLADGEEVGGNFGEVPAITLELLDPVNNLGEGDPGITFGEPGIGLGELAEGPTPLLLLLIPFFLKVSLARRLLGGDALTFDDNTEARWLAASAFVVGGVPLPALSVVVVAGAVVGAFEGSVSDFLAAEGEGGGRGFIFTELLLFTAPLLL